MKKLFFIFFLFLSVYTEAQYYTESFETCDSLHLPLGWFKFNNRPWILVDPLWNWTVRDSGSILPGIIPDNNHVQKSYDGVKALGVTWWTSGAYDTLSDAWLVTKKFNNIPADGNFSFYACGGSPLWCDSIQIWVSTTDSVASSFTNYIGTIIWLPGSAFGVFNCYSYDLSGFAEQNIRIAFRYMSSHDNGFAVMLDYFRMFGTVGIQKIDANVPKLTALKQNFPNPFNAKTKIQFQVSNQTSKGISGNKKVSLKIFDIIGYEVTTLVNRTLQAGAYEIIYDASSLSSGIYFYTLIAGDYKETKRMTLIK